MSSRLEVREKLVELINANTKLKMSSTIMNDEDKLNAARLIEDLKADSLDIVELVMSIEEAFGIEVPDDDFGNIKTFGEMVDYIEKKKSSSDESANS